MTSPHPERSLPLRTTRKSRRGVLRDLAGAGAVAALAAAEWAPGTARAQAESVTPVTGHPRLWLTADDLPRLRARASDDNPLWRDGILVRAESLVANMDSGLVPGGDTGSYAWEQYPTENYAAFFAFLSLIHPDATAREDYAERARTLLLHVITAAALGPAPDEPFRDPAFAVFDRSRWWGECFPLTVDWIYDRLAVDEKAIIRDVFLRWVDENLTAETTTANHPVPVGVVNDPILLADPLVTRWAGNNYFSAHMRNIGLMALAVDPADDPDGALTGAVANATGAWLYMIDNLLRGDVRGGLPPEGFEYSPQAIGYVAQFLLALHTAGRDDPALAGPQVVLNDNPFWDEIIPAYLHSLSPTTVTVPDWEWLGEVYQPAWYGDGQRYWGPDFIGVFGALGRYDHLTGNAPRLDAQRWIQTHLPPGGAERLITRVAEAETFSEAIWYFLLFDPDAASPADPHGETPLAHFSTGIGRYLHRTSWDPDATWFTYALGWNTVDHQHCDGNQFEFFRQGEWLTKERTGYGFNIAASDYHNTLALENDPPEHNDPEDYRAILWARGSQWMLVPDADPVIVTRSTSDEFVYFLGDATNLYNSSYEGSLDILHASRSIVWLPPDHIIIYDRAASRTDGRFKRFWLNLPAPADVRGKVATMLTGGGQQLVVSTLLPADAEISSEPAEPLAENSEPAIGEPMQFRLRVEAPGGPREVRFFHVLQGTAGGVAPDEALLIKGEGGAPFAGVVVASTAVLFPVDIESEVTELTYMAPAGTTRHLITGLTPGGSYDVTLLRENNAQQIALQPGAGLRADDGGVLRLTLPG